MVIQNKTNSFAEAPYEMTTSPPPAVKKNLITTLFIFSLANTIMGLETPKDCWKKQQTPFGLTYSPNRDPYSCPAVDLREQRDQTYLEAVQILGRTKVQDALVDNQFCPYGSPGYNSLNQWTVFKHLQYNTTTKFAQCLLNHEFQQELDQFNQHKPDHESKFYKSDLIDSCFQNYYYDKSDGLDITRFSEVRSPLDTTTVKLLKSIGEIRLAKPGDKDIALVLIANPNGDWNGAISLKQIIIKTKTFWQQISPRYPIHFVQVSNIKQVYQSANKARKLFNNIKIMHFLAHGDENSIELSAGSSKDQRREFSLKSINAFTRENPTLPIDSDGALIFHSCSGGLGGLTNPNNLVNRMALMHPGVSVMGLTKSSGSAIKALRVDSKNFIFESFEDSRIMYKAKAIPNPNFPFNVISVETAESLGLCRHLSCYVIKELDA